MYLSADAIASLHECLKRRPATVPGDYVFWNQKRPTRCPQHLGGHSRLLELVARQDLLPAIDRRRALAPDMAARPRQVTSLARGHRQHTM